MQKNDVAMAIIISLLASSATPQAYATVAE
jgi:hypothetical protein